MNKILTMDCGCQFDLDKSGNPILELDINKTPLDCPRVWDMISEGNTIGGFQIESGLGQTMSKQLKPENIDNLAALVAIMRPSCISEDTKICIYNYSRKDQTNRFKKIKIKDLYNQFHNKNNAYQNRIISYDEINHKLINNKIIDIWSNGIQDIISISFKKNPYRISSSIRKYNFSSTKNHKVFVFNKGWIEVQNLQNGDRFLILSDGEGRKKSTQQKGIFGRKIYHKICFHHYEYKCVLCDWKEGSLDVNHLEGNRQSNNSPDNLCYLCPNHHRMYTQGKISKEKIIEKREKYRLPQHPRLFWAEFISYENAGRKEVFDIETKSLHHNFIAGDIIVHNCLKGKLEDGKSIAQHFMDRKNGLEAATCPYSQLEYILSNTFGLMIFQEQAIKIGQDIAGMSLKDSDYYLRKGIGKKIATIIAEGEKIFLDGCKKVGKVDQKEAAEIWDWIKSAQRYSFNASHSYGYALITYQTIYAKSHLPLRFFCSYLNHSYDRPKPLDEIKNLVLNARINDIDILNPDIRLKNENFTINEGRIHFGLKYIKEVGEVGARTLIRLLQGLDLNTLSWAELLFKTLLRVNKTVVKRLIAVGGLDYLKIDREQLLFEHDTCLKFTQKELDWIINNIDLSQFHTITPIFTEILNHSTGKGQPISNKNRKNILTGIQYSVINPSHPAISNIERLVNLEKSFLGIAISCSLLDTVENSTGDTFIKEFNQGKGGIVKIMGELAQVKVIKTKKSNEDMAFITMIDTSSQLNDIVAFPQVYEKYKNVLFENNIALIIGRRGERGNFIINEAKQV